MSELGKTLKEKRENLNLSLSEASLSTKIGARMIAAMEEGDFKALPALPFAKGFVRSYASYLKLDPDKMVALYLDEIGESVISEPEAELNKEESGSPAKVDINEDSNSLTRYIIIGSVVFLIVAIVGVKNIIDKYKKEADVSHQEEVVASPIEKDVTEEEVKSEIEPEAVKDVEKVEKPVEPQDVEVAQEATEVKAPAVEEAEPPPPPKPEPVTAVVTEPAPAPTTQEQRQVEILLEALDRVQINLSVGGSNRRVSLNAGEIHILRTDEKVQLDISDGGAINLVVNGQNRGVPGSLGQRKTVQLP